MTEEQRRRISRFLSRHLRHEPGALRLTLEPGGWVPVEALLRGCERRGLRLTRADLEEVVARCDRQRYSLDESGDRIRANQGHSVEIDLQLTPAAPPESLYHGTPERFADAIAREGLRRMSRHHVHLSPDRETAVRVGSRRGRPVIFEIEAGRMHREGHRFYCSENGVWLTDAVPPAYLRRLP